MSLDSINTVTIEHTYTWTTAVSKSEIFETQGSVISYPFILHRLRYRKSEQPQINV